MCRHCLGNVWQCLGGGRSSGAVGACRDANGILVPKQPSNPPQKTHNYKGATVTSCGSQPIINHNESRSILDSDQLLSTPLVWPYWFVFYSVLAAHLDLIILSDNKDTRLRTAKSTLFHPQSIQSYCRGWCSYAPKYKKNVVFTYIPIYLKRYLYL